MEGKQQRDLTQRRFLIARLAYYATLIVIAASIGFYFGPSWFLFGKLRWIRPSDYRAIALNAVVPIIQAIKQYELDHGSFGDRVFQIEDDLRPYLEAYTSPQLESIHINDRNLYCWTSDHYAVIIYALPPKREAWSVGGPFTRGPLDLPPVIAATRPTTQP